MDSSLLAPKRPTTILVLGARGVGKSSLVNAFIYHEPLLQPESDENGPVRKHVSVQTADGTEPVEIWEAENTDELQNVLVFSNHIDGCMLVYAVDNPASFDRLTQYRDAALINIGPPDPERFPFVVVANKEDADTTRKISTKRGRAWTQQKGDNYSYFETEARAADPQKAIHVFDHLLQEIAVYKKSGSSSSQTKKKKTSPSAAAAAAVADPLARIALQPFGVAKIDRTDASGLYADGPFSWLASLVQAEHQSHRSDHSKQPVYMLDAQAQGTTIAQTFFHTLACCLWQRSLPGSALEHALLDFAMIPSKSRKKEPEILAGLRNALHGSAKWMNLPVEVLEHGALDDSDFPAKALTYQFDQRTKKDADRTARLAHAVVSLVYQFDYILETRLSSYSVANDPDQGDKTAHCLCSCMVANGHEVHVAAAPFQPLGDRPPSFSDDSTIGIFFVNDRRNLRRFVGFSPFPAGRKFSPGDFLMRPGVGASDADDEDDDDEARNEIPEYNAAAAERELKRQKERRLKMQARGSSSRGRGARASSRGRKR